MKSVKALFRTGKDSPSLESVAAAIDSTAANLADATAEKKRLDASRHDALLGEQAEIDEYLDAVKATEARIEALRERLVALRKRSRELEDDAVAEALPGVVQAMLDSYQAYEAASDALELARAELRSAAAEVSVSWPRVLRTRPKALAGSPTIDDDTLDAIGDATGRKLQMLRPAAPRSKNTPSLASAVPDSADEPSRVTRRGRMRIGEIRRSGVGVVP